MRTAYSVKVEAIIILVELFRASIKKTLNTVITFADIEIDKQRYEIRRNGKLVPTEPLIFDLIAYLSNNPEKVFSRDDLINAVWQGRVVSDSTVSSAIKSARKALGDNGTKQLFIKTVHGRGFRFVADTPKTENRTPDNETSLGRNETIITDPVIIILPLKCLEHDARIENFVNGVISSIETILTRVPLLRINALPTSSIQQQLYSTARQIHEELGVDFVIDGLVQVMDEQLRFNINLSDAKSGFRLWSEQFECSLKFDAQTQDTLVLAILGKLEPQLNRAIYNNLQTHTEKPNSRQLYLLASSILATKGWHQKTFLQAADLLQGSCRLDQNFPHAPAYLSLILALGHRVGLLGNSKKTKHEVIAAADKALELDNMDSTVLGFCGCALADIGVLPRAFGLLKNSIQLNSANAQAWSALGSAYFLDNQTDKAIEHLTHGIKISPLDSRLSIWQSILALALLKAEKLSDAKHTAQHACQHDDNTYMPRVVLAAIQAVTDEPAAAQSTLNDAYRIKSDLSVNEIQALLGKKLSALLPID